MNPYINPYGFTPEQDEAVQRIAISRMCGYHEVANAVLGLSMQTNLEAIRDMQQSLIDAAREAPRSIAPRRDARRAHRKRLKRQR